MNRRVFIKTSTLIPIESIFYFRGKERPIKVTYESIPKVQDTYFNSVNDFFYNFYQKSQKSYLFNIENVKSGKVISIRAYLSSNGKTVNSYYIYKNWKAFIECEKLWQKKYLPSLDPVKHIIKNIVWWKKSTLNIK